MGYREIGESSFLLFKARIYSGCVGTGKEKRDYTRTNGTRPVTKKEPMTWKYSDELVWYDITDKKNKMKIDQPAFTYADAKYNKIPNQGVATLEGFFNLRRSD